MKQTNSKMKAIYVGTAATLLLSTITPSMAQAKIEVSIEQFEHEEDLFSFVQEQLFILDNEYVIEMNIEEDRDLFLSTLEEKVKLFQDDNELEVTGEIDDKFLEFITLYVNELASFVQEQLFIIDEQYKIDVDLEEDRELFLQELEKQVKLFQENTGLDITGKLDDELVEAVIQATEELENKPANTKKDINEESKSDELPENKEDVVEESQPDESIENKKDDIEKDLVEEPSSDDLKENQKEIIDENDVKTKTVEKTNENQKRMTEASTFSAVSKASSSTELKKGVRHKDVITLKANLKKLGLTVPGNGTNLFGVQTEVKVKDFQKYYGLKVTGIANDATLKKIDSILKSPLQKGKRNNDVKKLKDDLKKTGYPVPGNGTNLFGVETEKVVKKFQKEQKLVVNGIADEVTLKKIAELVKIVDPDVLENGVRHAKVKTLKANLKKLGFTVPGNGTNLFGIQTEAKVKEFQKYYGLSVTGKVNKTTENKIQSILKSPLQKGKSNNDVKKLKADLKKIGYPVPGNGTNLFGVETEKVVKKFQKEQKLVVNGIADEITLKKIAELVKKAGPDVLENGVRHERVKTLKANLKKLGFTVPGSGTTLYGAQTEKRVKEFQKYYGLSVTGKVNNKTEDKIQSILKSPLQKGKSSTQIADVKKQLNKIGYGGISVTNYFGDFMEKRVKEFQKDKGLPVSGIVEEVTLKKINELYNNTKPVTKTEYTNYNLTLTQAVNRQLADSVPQTDKYKNDPAYVSANLINISGKAKSIDDQVTIHSKPNLLYPTTTKLTKDEEVTIVNEVSDEITRKNDEWLEISNNGKKGYVEKASLRATEGVITGSTVNVRAGKNTSSHIYGTLNKGAKVNVLDATGSWYEIQYNTWRLPTATDLSKEMNPSNVDKFQHLRLDSLAGATASQLNKMLNGKGTLNKQGQAFINGAKQGKVNEAYLISHASLETGNGTSKLAQGIEVGKNKSGKPTVVTSSNRGSLTAIKKVYNMYGIGAVDSNPNNAGAIRAYEEGWDTPKKAIEGGAKWVGQQYIHNSYKQNTLYKMRWNPRMSEGYAWKQYATDIGWARKQISRIKEVYSYIDQPNYHYDIAKYK